LYKRVCNENESETLKCKKGTREEKTGLREKQITPNILVRKE
jgi:hypothetical protein